MIYDLLYEIVIYDRLPDLSHVIVSILLSFFFFTPFLFLSFRFAFSKLCETRVFETRGKKLVVVRKAFVILLCGGRMENRGRRKFSDKRVNFLRDASL